jgi:hypothetical protein
MEPPCQSLPTQTFGMAFIINFIAFLDETQTFDIFFHCYSGFFWMEPPCQSLPTQTFDIAVDAWFIVELVVCFFVVSRGEREREK